MTSKLVPIVLAFVLPVAVAACGTPDAESSPSATTAGTASSELDRTRDPCTDFDEFANGGWFAANPIPPGQARWGRRAIARDATRRKVQGILDQVSAHATWPAHSVEQLTGDFYASCMDETAIDAAGVAPLARVLADIDAAATPADVQRMIRRLHELAIAVPFGVTGGLDYHAPLSFSASVVAGTFGLPDRDYYMKSEPHFADARVKYRAHIARTLQLAGWAADRAEQAATDVVALETRLAQVALDTATAADPAKIDHVTQLTDLQRLAPTIDWAAYFDEAKLPRAAVNVDQPALILRIDAELAHTPVAAWKSYLTWQLLDSASPFLSRPFVAESFGFKEQFLGGADAIKPRAQRCAEWTEALLPDPLGKQFVAKYFSPAAKAKVLGAIHAMLAVLKDDVKRVDWMTPATKAAALAKLATYNPQVGYPDQWKDYASVVIRRDAFWANIAAARRFGVDDNRRQVGKPTAKNLWQAPSASAAGAYLDLQLNEIVLPAGFLQPPLFDPDANEAVLYGGLGAGVAHDMTHPIDADGAQIDPVGRPIKWWGDADDKQFAARAQCLVDQFDGYTIEPDVHLQGKVVRSEAIGDLAGVRIAYLAFERSLRSHPVPTVDGFTPEQQFFIAYAHFRGEAVTLETQRKLAHGDPHPIAKFRILGPLSNTPEFQRAFACTAGAKMVKLPRCAVW